MLLLLLGVIRFFVHVGATSEGCTTAHVLKAPQYGYTNGAAYSWHKLKPEYALCGEGRVQSPINVKVNYSESAVPPQISHDMAVLRFGSGTHNFHFKCASELSPCGKMVAKGVTYHLHGLHMHSPSENQLSGRQYELEAHLVHRAQSGALAVLGVLFEVGKPNSELQHLLDAAAKEHYAVVNLTALTKAATSDGCGFDGSLTTPPCIEGVNWFLSLRVMEASLRQIGQFREICGESSNSRPVQLLNGRQIACFSRKRAEFQFFKSL